MNACDIGTVMLFSLLGALLVLGLSAMFLAMHDALGAKGVAAGVFLIGWTATAVALLIMNHCK